MTFDDISLIKIKNKEIFIEDNNNNEHGAFNLLHALNWVNMFYLSL